MLEDIPGGLYVKVLVFYLALAVAFALLVAGFRRQE